MNILIVANIPPWVTGGAETQALRLAEQFIERGHRVAVAGQLIPRDAMAEQVDNRIELIHIPFVDRSKLLRGVSYALGLAWTVLRHHARFDVVYCRFVREAAVVLGLVKRFLGLRFPLVSCSACAGPVGCASFLRSLPFGPFFADTINRTNDRINNISPKTSEELAEFGLKQSLFTFIPNGTRIPDQIREYFDEPVSSMVCLSRLASNKGIADLITALRQVIEDGYDLQLTLIGDGPERENLNRLVKENGLQDRVTFLGHIDNRDIYAHLVQHHIFVLPSWSEGFATVVIEAMSVGLPVIVTRSGGPEYFVDDEVGRVCDVGDVACLATRVRELVELGPRVLYEMGRRGRERVQLKFEIGMVADQYISLFQSIVNSDGASGATTDDQ